MLEDAHDPPARTLPDTTTSGDEREDVHEDGRKLLSGGHDPVEMGRKGGAALSEKRRKLASVPNARRSLEDGILQMTREMTSQKNSGSVRVSAAKLLADLQAQLAALPEENVATRISRAERKHRDACLAVLDRGEAFSDAVTELAESWPLKGHEVELYGDEAESFPSEGRDELEGEAGEEPSPPSWDSG